MSAKAATSQTSLAVYQNPIMTATLRRGVDEKRRQATADDREYAERDEGAAPADAVDQPFRDLRHHQGAEADARDGNARGEAAPAHEPALHRADRRHIGEADADADADAVAEIDLPQRLGLARDDQPGADDDEAGERHAARADPVGKRTANGAEKEIDEDGDREDPGQRRPGGVEGVLQRREEGREAVGAAEGREHDAERARDDAPPPSSRPPVLSGYARSMHARLAIVIDEARNQSNMRRLVPAIRRPRQWKAGRPASGGDDCLRSRMRRQAARQLLEQAPEEILPGVALDAADLAAFVGDDEGRGEEHRAKERDGGAGSRSRSTVRSGSSRPRSLFG